MAVSFITWFWGTKFSERDVLKLRAGLLRNYKRPHRLLVFADRVLENMPDDVRVQLIPNPELIGRGCFCRLRMFDPVFQAWHGLDDVIVSLDLDLVMVANFDTLFDRPESFVILSGVNAVNPNPFNCSVMMLRAGHHADVWDDFTVDKANAARFHEFADDQGWIWHKLPDAATWRGGKQSGIYAFQKPGWPIRRLGSGDLPDNARIVAFVGWRKPENFIGLPWVRQHWRTQ